MATASPTPLGSSYQDPRLPLRPLRAAQYNIGAPKRTSPLAKVITVDQSAPRATGGADDDSSDDESSAAPVLSAAAEELLGGRSGSRPAAGARQSHVRDYAQYAPGSPLARDSGSAGRYQPGGRSASPSRLGTRSKSPRIVRLGHGSPRSEMLRRARSTNSTNGSPVQRELRDYKTPAPRPKTYMGNETGSPVSAGQHVSDEPQSGHYSSSGKSLAYSSSGGADVREGLSQGTTAKDYGMHSSIRIKRLGQGTFLRGPARRGLIRRQSEEDQSPSQRDIPNSDEPQDPVERAEKDGESPAHEHNPSRVRFAGGPAEEGTQPAQLPANQSTNRQNQEHHKHSEPTPQLSSSAHRRAQSVPQIPVERQLLSEIDKENEPPPTFRRDKPVRDALGEAPLKPLINILKEQDHVSPKRPVLSSKSANTPLRPAPPPPKMNVIDTATAAAGAMASQKRKKQATASMTVNGRRFTRLDCIGRGGSSKVFRVMAENYKLYALKRVSLEGLDEMAICGFKGEINLLQKLKDVDRVVRLIDYEVNDERQTLTVLMEMGELDLKKLLDPRLDEQTGVFDVTFTRYIWREMLECVAAVHAHDVVHSDLKPANFVMVQGKLKLIDFGIANAIADDTVNVHREQQVGTPNYMAPEALVDTNVHERGGAALGAPTPVGKLMKLGKPSDVWTLGVILYQIVYGRPPFGHLTTTHSKVMAIVSEKHVIPFPPKGLGGTPVPLGLLRTMKRCLQRNQALRPSIEELLGERDPFLHPDADGLIPLSEELLGMIQRKLVSVVRQRGGAPDDGELAMWQKNMFENVRNAIKEGKVTV